MSAVLIVFGMLIGTFIGWFVGSYFGLAVVWALSVVIGGRALEAGYGVALFMGVVGAAAGASLGGWLMLRATRRPA